MKKQFLLVAVLLFFSLIVLAAQSGDPCNYYFNGDRECDVENSLYCTGYSCQIITNPETFCTDADSNNIAVAGDVSYRYRDYDGRFIDGTAEDECVNGNLFVSNCAGTDCKIREATCDNGNYVFQTHNCDVCSSGACTSWQPPSQDPPQDENTENGVLGNACNYYMNQDSECDAGNYIYCINNVCTAFSGGYTPYCFDSDDLNYFNKGDVNYSYRNADDGNIMSEIKNDYCLDENRLTELECSSPTSGYYSVDTINCANGCADGACIESTVPLPGDNCFNGIHDLDEEGVDCGGAYCESCQGEIETVSDSQLLNFISKWAEETISDEKMLELIEIWKNS